MIAGYLRSGPRQQNIEKASRLYELFLYGPLVAGAVLVVRRAALRSSVANSTGLHKQRRGRRQASAGWWTEFTSGVSIAEASHAHSRNGGDAGSAEACLRSGYRLADDGTEDPIAMRFVDGRLRQFRGVPPL